MVDIITNADVYFNANLSKTLWAGHTTEEKELAINTAYDDVIAYLQMDSIDDAVLSVVAPFSIIQKSIYEWALYLLEYANMFTALEKRAIAGVTSQSISGVGSEAYAQSSLSPKEQAFHKSKAGILAKSIPNETRIIH